MYTCPVCEFPNLLMPPGNHEICPVCKTEYDYHDVGFTYTQLRDAWKKRNKIKLNCTSLNFQEIRTHIYGLAHNISINGIQQKALVSELHDIEAHAIKCGDSKAYTIQCMLSCIYSNFISNKYI